MHIEYDKINQISQGESFICLFSGGKDSGLALSIAAKQGNPMAVILSVDLRNNTSCYHKQPIKVIENQAQSMGLPLELIDAPPRTSLFAYKLVRIMKKYSRMGVKTLIAGTTHDKEAVELCQKLCDLTGYTFKCPLWKMPFEDVINKIEENNVKTVITLVDENKLSIDWLGKYFDRFAYESFVNIGIHPLGECDEFHTTLVNMDIFNTPLKYKLKFRGDNAIELEIVSQSTECNNK